MLHGNFQVLLICTANQCRSPLMEHLWRNRLTSMSTHAAVSMSSAGTWAVDGRRIHPLAGRVLDEMGIETRHWRSRRVTPEMIESADLILTAEARNRTQIVTMRPPGVTRTFQLLQFAHLSQLAKQAGMSATRPDELVSIVRKARSLMGLRSTQADDLVDPIGQQLKQFRTCAADIARAIDAVMGLLVPG